MLAQDNIVLRKSDRFGGHDLVRDGGLEHAVLMNAGFMRESVATDDRLVRLNIDSGNLGEESACLVNLPGINGCVYVHVPLAHLDRHDDLFKRCVAGAFANTVDCAFDLARSIPGTRKTVRDSKAKVIVAMRTDGNAFEIRNSFRQVSDHPA